MTKGNRRRRHANVEGGKSVRKIVEDLFAQKIKINRAGVRHSSTVFMAICEQLAAKSAAKDDKAIKALMKYVEFARKRGDTGPLFLVLPEPKCKRSKP